MQPADRLEYYAFPKEADNDDSFKLLGNKATEGPKVHRFSFHGSGGSLFGIQIVNLFLTLVMLGIYSILGPGKSAYR